MTDLVMYLSGSVESLPSQKRPRMVVENSDHGNPSISTESDSLSNISFRRVSGAELCPLANPKV